MFCPPAPPPPTNPPKPPARTGVGYEIATRLWQRNYAQDFGPFASAESRDQGSVGCKSLRNAARLPGLARPARLYVKPAKPSILFEGLAYAL